MRLTGRVLRGRVVSPGAMRRLFASIVSLDYESSAVSALPCKQVGEVV